jgi:hypothetical protein
MVTDSDMVLAVKAAAQAVQLPYRPWLPGKGA